MTEHYVYEVPRAVYEDSPIEASGNDKQYGFHDFRVTPSHYRVETHEEYSEWADYLVDSFDDE